eukprot:COSAG05_NODE_289_length_12065_cov_9.271519_1_plen_125_part_00
MVFSDILIPHIAREGEGKGKSRTGERRLQRLDFADLAGGECAPRVLRRCHAPYKAKNTAKNIITCIAREVKCTENRRRNRGPGKKRVHIPSCSITPASSAAAYRAFSSAESDVNGFSHSTCKDI